MTQIKYVALKSPVKFALYPNTNYMVNLKNVGDFFVVASANAEADAKVTLGLLKKLVVENISYQEDVSAQADGENKVFQLQTKNHYLPGSVKITVSGVTYYPTTEDDAEEACEETDANSGIVTLTDSTPAPESGKRVVMECLI